MSPTTVTTLAYSPFQPTENAERIAVALRDIPAHWSLTPLQEKTPRRKNWQSEPAIPHQEIADSILNGQQGISPKTGKPYKIYSSGFGIRLGEASGGIVAIDVDGASAKPLLDAMSGGNIPETVAWTSGKAGRYQLAFQIPLKLRSRLEGFTRSVITEWEGLQTLRGEDGRPIEMLEFRYNKCQSVLPPSLHPTTGTYHWVNSPIDTQVAIAPEWLCNALLSLAESEQRTTEAKSKEKLARELIIKESAQKRKALGITGSLDLGDCFAQSVARLSPQEIFNWSDHNFRERGSEWFGCCPRHQSQSGKSFTVRPDDLSWKCFGCNVGGGVAQYRHFVNSGNGTPKGKDFFQVTKELASQAGIELPKSEKALGFAKPEQETSNQTKSWKKYLKPIQELPKVGFHVVRTCQEELLPKFEELKTKRGEEWLKLRKFTPDVVINQKYFDYNFKPNEDLAINSGLGTGKSYFTNAKFLANPNDGAILGGYRNCLNEQFCANGEKLNGRAWYQIQSDLKGSKDLSLISDSQSRIAGAVDSWVYFSPHHFDGKKVIFDEVESVAKHLNQSNTAVSYYRDTIKSRVSDALQNSSTNLIADGNLRDFTVDYFEKLSGRKFTKILNEYKGNRGKIYLYDGSSRKRKTTELDVQNGLCSEAGEWISFDNKPDDYSKLHRIMMDLPIDIPALILSDSQKKCEAWDRELTALGRKVFRLDSTSSGSELGKLFLQNPKEFILSGKFDAVILSPSAESGVSIELADELEREIPGYFKYEFAYFFGISTTDTQAQFLGRNRDPYTTKFVFCQTHSLPTTRAISDNEDSQNIFSTWFDTVKECASLTLEGIEEGKALDIALEKIKARLSDPHLQYEAKVILKESFERAYPRLCLEYALRESGWEVLLCESREDNLSDLLATQEEISMEKAVQIFEAESISASEATKLAPKLKKSPEERNQIAKSRLVGRLPGIEEKSIIDTRKVKTLEPLEKLAESATLQIVSVKGMTYEEWKASPQEIPGKGVEVIVEKPAFDPDFINNVLNKDRGFISRLEMQLLLRNPELAKVIQQNKWHKWLNLMTDPDSVSLGSIPIARYRSRWLEINTLYKMGIEFFLKPESKWSDETPEAIAFWKQGKLIKNAKAIGVKHEDSVNTYIGRTLKRFGLETQFKGKTREDKSRYREYSLKEMNPLSQAVYSCVAERIENQLLGFVFDWKKIVKNAGLEVAETLPGQALQFTHLPPDNLIETSVEVCKESKPVNWCLAGVENVAKSETEELVEAFEFTEDAETFAFIVEGIPLEVVNDAIALSSPQTRQLELQKWFDELSQPKEVSAATVGFYIGQKLLGLRYSFKGKIAKVTQVFEDWCETTLGTVDLSEIESGAWSFTAGG